MARWLAEAWDGVVVTPSVTDTGLTTNTAVIANASGTLASVAAVTNGVLISGAPPSFSATPTVTSLTATSSVAAGTTPATTGLFRSSGNLPAGGILAARNTANSADLRILTQDAGNNILIGDPTTTQIVAPGQDNLQQLGASSLRWIQFWVSQSIRSGSAGLLDIGFASEGIKRLYLDFTNTATVGPVTISKAAGRVNLAAAGASLVVTNTLVTAASHIVLNAASAPGNAVAVQLFAVPAAGSFTINAVPAVTNQTAIDFFVVNAD